MICAREKAIFEAGITLGALYHQWGGSPVSPQTAATLERAIEASVSLQPFVERVTVHLDRNLMAPNTFGYSELSGLMFDVEIVTRVDGVACRAKLRRDGTYPLMEIVE